MDDINKALLSAVEKLPKDHLVEKLDFYNRVSFEGFYFFGSQGLKGRVNYAVEGDNNYIVRGEGQRSKNLSIGIKGSGHHHGSVAQ